MKNKDSLDANLLPISRTEIACRRAFEEWCRRIGKPGKLGFPDTVELKDFYRGWRAAWLYLKEEQSDPWVNK